MIKKIKYSISDLQNASDENLISLIFEKAVEFEIERQAELPKEFETLLEDIRLRDA